MQQEPNGKLRAVNVTGPYGAFVQVSSGDSALSRVSSPITSFYVARLAAQTHQAFT